MPTHEEPGSWAELNSSPWGVCLNWLADEIITLALPDIGGNVWIRDPAIVKGDDLPVVIVTPAEVSHDDADGTLTAPEITVGAEVGFAYASDGAPIQTLAARLYAHHKIFNQFAKRSRPSSLHTAMQTYFSTVGVMWVECRPLTPSSGPALKEGFAAGSLMVRFRLRYPNTA